MASLTRNELTPSPKHPVLYQYVGRSMPVRCHLPLLRNPDQIKPSQHFETLFKNHQPSSPQAVSTRHGA